MSNGEIRDMPIADIAVDSALLVRQDSAIPLDGMMISGASGVDESMLTGDSMPVTKVAAVFVPAVMAIALIVAVAGAVAGKEFTFVLQVFISTLIIACPCTMGLATFKTTHRSHKEHAALINRLKRIEGQVRGIRAMVEEDKYCVDILNQVAAARTALSAFSKVVFASHIRTCVRDGIRTGSDDVIPTPSINASSCRVFCLAALSAARSA